jgi:hypothetical protein
VLFECSLAVLASAGNLHAGFEEAGSGNQFTVRPYRRKSIRVCREVSHTVGNPSYTPTNLNGCPTFASAYVGQKDGAKPIKGLSVCSLRTLVLAQIEFFSSQKAAGRSERHRETNCGIGLFTAATCEMLLCCMVEAFIPIAN